MASTEYTDNLAEVAADLVPEQQQTSLENYIETALMTLND